MKKYNIQNYIRYKEDVKVSMPEDKFYDYYTRDELIIRFMPLVENLARKFSTTQQASGVLSINDLIQEGNKGLTLAVDKLDWNLLTDSKDIEKTLKSFFSKRIKGAIRRRIDMVRGNIRIPEHKLTEIRKNPKDVAMVQMFLLTQTHLRCRRFPTHCAMPLVVWPKPWLMLWLYSRLMLIPIDVLFRVIMSR